MKQSEITINCSKIDDLLGDEKPGDAGTHRYI